MTIQPQKLGRYLEIDSNGFVIPDVNLGNIKDEWLEVVNYLVSQIVKNDEIISVYIRGSVPRGLAIKNSSDIDLICFCKYEIEHLERNINTSLKQRFPFVRGLEIVQLDEKLFTSIYPPQKRPYFQMLLKTQGLLLWGKDMTNEILPFKPGIDLISHGFALKDEFIKLPQWIEEDEDQESKKETVRWFFRRLVRSGLEVTLENHKKYTRDLYYCFEIFAKTYPDKEEIMRLALVNSLNACYDISIFRDLVAFIDDEMIKKYPS